MSNPAFLIVGAFTIGIAWIFNINNPLAVFGLFIGLLFIYWSIFVKDKAVEGTDER